MFRKRWKTWRKRLELRCWDGLMWLYHRCQSHPDGHKWCARLLQLFRTQPMRSHVQNALGLLAGVAAGFGIGWLLF